MGFGVAGKVTSSMMASKIAKYIGFFKTKLVTQSQYALNSYYL